MFDNRKYVVIPYSEIGNVDFTQVMETSMETVRRSVNGNLTFVKYIGEMPSSIFDIANKSQEYSHQEFLDILSGLDWSPVEDEI